MLCPAWSKNKGMRSLRACLLLASLFGPCLPLAAASPAYAVDQNGDGKPDQWYEVADGRVSSLSQDRNYDGQVDYLVEYDRAGRKVREEMDFDFDGRMDDFYFFEKGALVRQEIDTNFDDRVDVWVFLEGPYIRRYEMDKDFNGQVDVVKDFGQ
jgi:hypothetical protein